VNLDGTDRRLLLTKVGHAYGVAVVEGMVYWTDWQTQSVWRANVTVTDRADTDSADTDSADTSVSVSRQVVVDEMAGLMDLHAASLTTRLTHTRRESVSLHRHMLRSDSTHSEM